MKKFNHEKLKAFVKAIFLSINATEVNAEICADHLVTAELRGIPSHGLIRILDYVRLYREGRLNPNPKLKILYETPSTATINGDKGCGLVVGKEAMEIAINKAKTAGTGWVAVNNSNHFGIAGYHAMMALEHDMIGLTFTNANPSVAPTFSLERLLGTNPIAMAAPAKLQPPFVADFSTSTVPRGKVVIAMRAGQKIPYGFIQTKDGSPTDDPNEVLDGGCLLPLGSDRVHSSHKGYCLGGIVDILSGVLSGANFGLWVPPIASYQSVRDDMPGVGTGHFFGAMRIDAFGPADNFKEMMDKWIATFRNSKTVEGEEKVIVPGDPERELTEIRKVEGIPVREVIIEDICKLAIELGVDHECINNK